MMKSNKLSTIDLKENKKFENFYNQWWDLKGPFEPLHNFNKIRIKYIKDNLDKKLDHFKPFKNLKILDIGCGGGILCEPLSRLGGNVTGIDISKKAIEIAKKHSQEEKLKINYFNEEVTSFKKTNNFDLITCMEVIEHIDNIDFFIKNAKRLLKKDGMLIGSTINKTVRSYFLAIILAENVLKLLPKNTHSWKKLIPTNFLKKKLIENKFSDISFQGSSYNPISKNWRFIDSLNVNYFFSAKYEGR